MSVTNSQSPVPFRLIMEDGPPLGATQSEIAYFGLRTAILKTTLMPNQVIDHETVQEIIGPIGTTPTRDALQRLASEGLVVIEPRRGTRVCPLSVRDLQEVFEARLSLELAIAGYSMRNKTPEHLESLRALLQANLSDSATPSEVESDYQMHQILLQMMNNRFLAATYQRVMDSSLRLMYFTGSQLDSRDVHIETLKSIIEAFEQEDLLELERVLADHVREFKSRVSSSLGMGNGDNQPQHSSFTRH